MKSLKITLGLLLAIALCSSLVISIAAAEDIMENFKHEPTIKEVQQAAIRYAEVQPEKIASWRRKAAVKGLFPEVSVDYDKTVYGYKGEFAIGPYDWGVTVKWDLADIIWDYSQTSIDVRSRLMVKLRNNILEKLNGLYFERRKLQIELLQDSSTDPDKKLDKQLRVEELTAQIDGLTEGYFSCELKEARRN